MTKPKKTWWVKRLSREEGREDSSDSSHDQEGGRQPEGELVVGAGDRQRLGAFEVNMVFVISAEFQASEIEVA
jgi:hypothetical protein